ncbi:MAG: hypothetical protein ACXWUG_11655 [Polyangiales bacterium]
MEAAQYDAWNALMERALEALRRGTDPRMREGVRVVTVVEIPLTGSARSWEIVRRRGHGAFGYVAARTRWLREHDQALLEQGAVPAHPSIDHEELTVDDATLSLALRKLQSVTFPLTLDAEPDIARDRTSYELHLVGSRIGASLRWWGDPPAEWATIATWVRELVTLLEGLRD